MNKKRKILLAGVAALLLLVGAIAAQGLQQWALAWVSAFVLISMVPIGSLALLLTFGITGGRWGSDLAPVLVPAARTLPLLLLAVIPILIVRAHILPLTGAAPDVAPIYFNPLFFGARSIAAILLWSFFAWAQIWRRPLTAALGLTAHLILISLIPPDWVLTLAPGSTSAGFGLGFGIEQMFAALAFAALLSPQGRDPRASRDLAGLIMTTLLGAIYFIYMQFLISWYGNVPEKVKWYVARAGGSWFLLALAAFLFGAVIPFGAILNHGVRRDPLSLRWVGVAGLIGVTLHVAWLTAPVGGVAVLAPAFLSALALGIFLMDAESSLPWKRSWSPS